MLSSWGAAHWSLDFYWGELGALGHQVGYDLIKFFNRLCVGEAARPGR